MLFSTTISLLIGLVSLSISSYLILFHQTQNPTWMLVYVWMFYSGWAFLLTGIVNSVIFMLGVLAEELKRKINGE